jgi:hypothetical protein
MVVCAKSIIVCGFNSPSPQRVPGGSKSSELTVSFVIYYVLPFLQKSAGQRWNREPCEAVFDPPVNSVTSYEPSLLSPVLRSALPNPSSPNVFQRVQQPDRRFLSLSPYEDLPLSGSDKTIVVCTYLKHHGPSLWATPGDKGDHNHEAELHRPLSSISTSFGPPPGFVVLEIPRDLLPLMPFEGFNLNVEPESNDHAIDIT